MAALLVGIDVGTTSTKTVLADHDGAIIAQASQEYATTYPHPGWAQQEPEDWWRATCATLNQVLAESRVNPQDIAGIGVSCQAPTMLAVDHAGRPLYPAMIWMDRRSEPQCLWLREHVDPAEIAGINGGMADPYYLGPKLLWYKENEPALYRQTHRFLQVNGYIIARLTGQYSIDMSHGPLSLFFDSSQGVWSEKLLAKMDIDPEKLPPILPCSAVVGEVSREAARETGLAAGTPVVAGAADGTAAGLEAGLVNVGDAAEMTGQSTVLMICSDKPYLGQQLIPLGHAVPGQHLVIGALVASGGALRWFRDQLGHTERQAASMLEVDPFELLSLEAQHSPPGANRLIFLPYMFGERSPIWDSDARGVFFGLSLATKKADMVRAIMEGAAFGLRHNVDAAAAAGLSAAHLACVGGGARSQVWNQIKADILNLPIRLPRAATGAPLGDIMMAAVGAGIYPGLPEAVKQMVSMGQEYRPRPEFKTRYDALYQVYLELYPALKFSFKNLAGTP